MDALRKIVLIACFLAVAISVLDMLYPSKKFDKQVHLIFTLLFVIGILTPVVSGNIKFSIPTSVSVEEGQTYKDIQSVVNSKYKSTVESNISKVLYNKLSDNQITVKEICTKVNISDDNSISISEVNVVSDSLEDNDNILNLIKSEVGQEINVVINQRE